MQEVLRSPFPYYGGKSAMAGEVWRRFGNTASFVEPFCGSSAVLLARPDSHEWWQQTETINDADGMISNVWRAIAADPEAVAHYGDYIVSENDLHARHIWLVGQKESLQTRLEGDPDYYDAKIAGYWLWGIACWIGGGWCSGKGPWTSVDGRMTRLTEEGAAGVSRRRVHLGNDGQGVNRQLVHLGDDGRGVNRQLVHLGPSVEGSGRGVCEQVHAGILAYMERLQNRLRRVRVCSGDWKRVVTPVAMRLNTGLVGVFLDPPYSLEANRDMGIYAVDCGEVAHEVRRWAFANGDDPRLRLCVAGYNAEMGELPPGWTAYHWTAQGGYGGQGEGRGKANREEEVLFFSPHCLKGDEARQMGFEL